MLGRLNAAELERHLDKIFQEMAKKGIRIDEQTKEYIKKDLTVELAGKFTAQEMNEPNLQKKLFSAITSYMLGKKDVFNDIVADLKDDDKRLEVTPKQELQLKNELKLLAALVFALELKLNVPENSLEPKLTPSQYVKKIMDAHPDKNNPEKKTELDMLSKQLEETLRNLYGGDDPRFAGEVPSIVFYVIGNLLGFTNQTTPDPTFSAFMTKAITFNSQDEDYLGLENLIKNVEDLSEGIMLDVRQGPQNVPPT